MRDNYCGPILVIRRCWCAFEHGPLNTVQSPKIRPQDNVWLVNYTFHLPPLQIYNSKQRNRHTSYAAFAAMNQGAGLFPELGVVGDGTILSPPSMANMETYCAKAFARVR